MSDDYANGIMDADWRIREGMLRELYDDILLAL